jgi:hypothetical protein
MPLLPWSAELANAEIERKEGEPIRIIKKPGRKGISPLESGDSCI